MTSDSLPAAPESTALAKDRPGVVTTLYAVTGLSSIGAALVALALLAMVWSGLANYATLLGVPPGSTEAWALPAFAVAAVIGIADGVWLRSSRPSVYQAIGVGAGP